MFKSETCSAGLSPLYRTMSTQCTPRSFQGLKTLQGTLDMMLGYSFGFPNDVLPGIIRDALCTSPRGPLWTTTALFHFLRRSYDKWRDGVIMCLCPFGSVAGQRALHNVLFYRLWKRRSSSITTDI